MYATNHLFTSQEQQQQQTTATTKKKLCFQYLEWQCTWLESCNPIIKQITFINYETTVLTIQRFIFQLKLALILISWKRRISNFSTVAY